MLSSWRWLVHHIYINSHESHVYRKLLSFYRLSFVLLYIVIAICWPTQFFFFRLGWSVLFFFALGPFIFLYARLGPLKKFVFILSACTGPLEICRNFAGPCLNQCGLGPEPGQCRLLLTLTDYFLYLYLKENPLFITLLEI